MPEVILAQLVGDGTQPGIRLIGIFGDQGGGTWRGDGVRLEADPGFRGKVLVTAHDELTGDELFNRQITVNTGRGTDVALPIIRNFPMNRRRLLALLPGGLLPDLPFSFNLAVDRRG